MRRLVPAGWFLSVSLLLAAPPGCREPQVVEERASPVCPTCKDQTKVVPALGLKYETHVCPGCRTVDPYPELQGDEVHYCEHCRDVVEPCPQCQKAAAR